MNLNETAKKCFEYAVKRQQNGAFKTNDTCDVLKHCATKIIEACAAYEKWDTVAQFTSDKITLYEYKVILSAL